mmetsp:Transcript_11890/g.18241  ORF Transcript_11890/g.18241 Transcript_11890/m.18241 type:complete len:117 (+) Transcript_11890:23-373(+)
MLWQNQLLAAIQDDNLDRVKEVCEKSKKLANGRYKDGSRPLHWACKIGSIEIVQNLMDQQDAEVNVEDHSGATPLDWAIQHQGNSHDVVQYLTERGSTFREEQNTNDEKQKTMGML